MIPADELLRDHYHFHSNLQMDSFITVKSGGTVYGCYMQSLKELEQRKRSIREREYGIAIAELDAADLKKKKDKRSKLKLKKSIGDLEVARDVLNDSRREFDRFHKQASALRRLLERDGITFPLTEESRDKLDNEFWCWQIKHMAAIDYLASGRISINTASLLMSLPVDMRRALVVEVRPDNGDALQEWLIQQEAVKPQALLNVQD